MPQQQSIKVLDEATITSIYNPNAVDSDVVFTYKNTKVPQYDFQLTKNEVESILEKKHVSAIEASADTALGLFQIGQYYQYYYQHALYPTPLNLEKAIYQLLAYAITGASLVVELSISNMTAQTIAKTPLNQDNPYYSQFPEQIAAQTKHSISLTNHTANPALTNEINAIIEYVGPLGAITIDIHKTFNKFDSTITAKATEQTMEEVVVTENNFIALFANLTVSKNLALQTAQNIYHYLAAISGEFQANQIVTESTDIFNLVAYNKASRIFNTRLQFRPYAIIYCKTTEQVQLAYQKAIEFNLPISVRSGGHDHEGECSGTNTILIDLKGLDTVTVDDQLIASIGPGNRFQTLTSTLAKNKTPVMIPHGTCATVGIAGFILGGGWGPWTRSKGMCCESLVGATLIDGQGNKRQLSANENQELLWALRGGGGLSYGIVTEFQIQTFKLPPTLIRFQVEWNPYQDLANTGISQPAQHKTTIAVLKEWEAAIAVTDPDQGLIGTNLKISGIPQLADQPMLGIDALYHNCIMYGYWQGQAADLRAYIAKTFGQATKGTAIQYIFSISGFGGADYSSLPYGTNLMGDWDREILAHGTDIVSGKALPPDYDQPAPHKITSRFVDAVGLDAPDQAGKKGDGYAQFLRTLTSPLILPGNRELGLFTYVTLGAISGEYYAQPNHQGKAHQDHSAFPYPDKRYTIQYQTWWNDTLAGKAEGQTNQVYNRVNRALDWMERARDAKIDHTSGAFISFKDSTIPTKTYFAQNYEPLITIKEKYSEDDYNHLRSRKTII